uniref:UL55 n=1 Tax=Panagrellus redivivus TaxID=6233 RepID=A0A7E4VT68_PANRE
MPGPAGPPPRPDEPPETSPATPRRHYDDANCLFVGHVQPRFTTASLIHGPTGSTSCMTPRSGTVCWYYTLTMLTSDFSCNVPHITGDTFLTTVRNPRPWPLLRSHGFGANAFEIAQHRDATESTSSITLRCYCPYQAQFFADTD